MKSFCYSILFYEIYKKLLTVIKNLEICYQNLFKTVAVALQHNSFFSYTELCIKVIFKITKARNRNKRFNKQLYEQCKQFIKITYTRKRKNSVFPPTFSFT